MKGKLSTRKFFKLGSKGIAHFVAPLVIVLLVGVVGTYMVVASHAATPRHPNNGGAPGQTTKKPKKEKKQPAYMVAYGQKDRFDSVKIAVADVPHRVTCGGSLTKAKPQVVRKTSTKPFRCTPINGISQYIVYYGKSKHFGNTYVAVDVDPGFCTLVYPDPAQIRKVPAEKGKCPGGSDTAPTKVDVAVSVNPSASSNGKSVKGYINVVAAEGVTRKQCSGDVMVTFKNTKTNESKAYRNPLKYVGDKRYNGGTPYCVATLAQDLKNAPKFLTKGTTYSVTAQYGGSIYFNAGSGSGSFTVPNKK